MRFGLPARHVHADFADEGLGHADIDAVDPGQVDAADAVQFMAQIKLWRMAPRLPAPLVHHLQPWVIGPELSREVVPPLPSQSAFDGHAGAPLVVSQTRCGPVAMGV